jgi:hypothetical protein
MAKLSFDQQQMMNRIPERSNAVDISKSTLRAIPRRRLRDTAKAVERGREFDAEGREVGGIGHQGGKFGGCQD